MSVIQVAIPVLKGKRRFHIAKGRPWSIVEHVILAAVVAKARTVNELSAMADLPRRLVLEALIRLMRAGWVKLSQEQKGVLFSATESGRVVVGNEELPQVTKTISRWMNFVIDKLTGTIYRSRELPFSERHVVQQRALRERLVWLEPREVEAFDDTAGILAALFEDDEKFISVDPSGDRMVERFAVVTVRNGSIEGLPSRAPPELERLVREAAKSAPGRAAGDHSPTWNPGPSPARWELSRRAAIDAVFRNEDLILGGQAHEEALRETIRRARNRVIIHSTFISEESFASIKEDLYDAAKRGVLIDVLWGQDDDKSDSYATSRTTAKLKQQIDEEGFGGSIRVHSFSTRSHAKVLVGDDGKTGRLSVIVGSCNWLLSRFQTYEASVRFSDPGVVSAVLEQLADLTRGYDRHWTELTSEIAQLAVQAKAGKVSPGVKAQVSVVLGAEHARYVRMARDTAKKNIFMTSHRLGLATGPAMIVPAREAVRAEGLQVDAYYGMHDERAGMQNAGTLLAAASREGIRIQQITSPRLHAKILAWDDDNVLITSLNWLSADPGDANPRREIGLFIQCPGVARRVIDNFESAIKQVV